MTDKSDRDRPSGRLGADGGKRAGAPPTVEEIEALLNGDLSEDEADRIRESLSHHPEMVRLLVQPSPPEDVRVLTDAERAADWAAIQKRLAPAVEVPAPIRRTWPRILAYAAAVLLVATVVVIIYVASRHTETPHPEKQVARLEMRPDMIIRGPQGPASITLPAADEYVLTPLTTHTGSARMEIVDLDTGQIVWTRPNITISPNGSFDITVPGSVLQPGGRFQFVLYDGGRQLETYTTRVSRR